METMADLFSLSSSRTGWLKKIRSSLKDPANLPLLLILLLAAFLRLFRISEYMTFLGDEGRDVIIAKEILEGNLTLLGPRASAGDFFLGPIYYYMIAPFLWFFQYDPVGPAIMVALIGVATVGAVYLLAARFISRSVGLMAASLYAISPVVIVYSRSSWNPNVVPFFAAAIIILSYLAVKRGRLWLYAWVGVLFGIAIQLHYIIVFLGVIIFLFIVLGHMMARPRRSIALLLRQLLVAGVGFFIALSPFILFEIRHGFPNTRAIFGFIFVGNYQDTNVQSEPYVSVVGDVLFRLFARFLFNYPVTGIPLDPLITIVAIWLLIVVSIISLFLIKDRLVLLLMSLWFFGSILLFGFYNKPIYDYYFGFIFPIPFILVSNLIFQISNLKKFKKIGITGALVLYIVIFVGLISKHPFQYTPNKQKAQAETIAHFILDKTNGRPYNFAMLVSGNSDHVYRYFFDVADRSPVAILNVDDDPDRSTVTDQLFVVCEGECGPLGHPLWEIAGFGRAEIENKWDVSVVTVYKLVPHDDR